MKIRLNTILTILLAVLLVVALAFLAMRLGKSNRETVAADSAASVAATVASEEEIGGAGASAIDAGSSDAPVEQTSAPAPVVTTTPVAPDPITPAQSQIDPANTSTEEQPEAPAAEAVDANGAGSPFADLSTQSYCYDAVIWATSSGIATGINDRSFGTDMGCTRLQMVTFLWNLAGQPMPTSNYSPFDDVWNPSQEGYYAVVWAVESGIVTGTGEETFSPESVVTRGQVVTFLWRYGGCGGHGDTAGFTDVSPDSPYYPATKWATESGITSGVGDDAFAPDEPCTRGQVVTMLYRYVIAYGEAVGGETVIDQEPEPIPEVDPELNLEWEE